MRWTGVLQNPVLNKEIRLRMRSIKTPLAILFYLGAIGLIAFSILFLMTMDNGGYFDPEQSKMLFMMLSFVQMALISFVAPGLTAGVISGERERQTLNILLTTQQSSTSIIIGKLVSSLAFLMLIVLATLPLYSLVFLFGGISPQQLLQTFGLFVVTMFILGSMGVFFSTLIRKTMIAMITTYGLGLFMYFGTFLILILLMESIGWQNASGFRTAAVFVMGFNPGAPLLEVFEKDLVRQIAGKQLPVRFWQLFTAYYAVLIAFFLTFSIRRLRPVLKRGK